MRGKIYIFHNSIWINFSHYWFTLNPLLENFWQTLPLFEQNDSFKSLLNIIRAQPREHLNLTQYQSIQPISFSDTEWRSFGAIFETILEINGNEDCKMLRSITVHVGDIGGATLANRTAWRGFPLPSGHLNYFKLMPWRSILALHQSLNIPTKNLRISKRTTIPHLSKLYLGWSVSKLQFTDRFDMQGHNKMFFRQINMGCKLIRNSALEFRTYESRQLGINLPTWITIARTTVQL